jgi:hypothetical protein
MYNKFLNYHLRKAEIIEKMAPSKRRLGSAKLKIARHVFSIYPSHTFCSEIPYLFNATTRKFICTI